MCTETTQVKLVQATIKQSQVRRPVTRRNLIPITERTPDAPYEKLQPSRIQLQSALNTCKSYEKSSESSMSATFCGRVNTHGTRARIRFAIQNSLLTDQVTWKKKILLLASFWG